MRNNFKHPLGKHTLKLVESVKNGQGRLSLIFRGIGEYEGFVVLRTFSLGSKGLKSFLTRYVRREELQKKELLEQLRWLRGSSFEVEITEAKNPKFVNINKFLN